MSAAALSHSHPRRPLGGEREAARRMPRALYRIDPRHVFVPCARTGGLRHQPDETADHHSQGEWLQ